MRYTWLFIIPPIAIAIIIFVAWYRYRMHSHDRDLRRVAVIAHTKTIKFLPAYRRAARHYRILMICAAISLLVTLFSLTASAARPIERQENKSIIENRDIVLCLDISGSMYSYMGDLLKYFKTIVKGLKSERIAVTIFDGKPANLIPLTDDHDALLEIIDTLGASDSKNSYTYTSRFAPIVSGTSTSAIGDGVMGCVNSLDLSEKNMRAKSVIIATDNMYGENKYGESSQSVDIGQVARYAARYNVTFYGLFTGDNVTYNDGINKKNEFKKAVEDTTGGTFHDLNDYYKKINSVAVAKDANSTIESIIKLILKQETAKIEGAPEVIYTDQPNVYLYISGICFLIFLAIIWRLRL